MPYDASTGTGVPDHVHGATARRQWANVWNSTFEETGSEERAFAEANAVYNRRKKKHKKLFKFGTSLTGYTKGIYGPFECGHCISIKSIVGESICRNPDVAEDSAVPEDEFGNKVVDGDDCCNYYWPISEEMEKKLMSLEKVKSGTFDEVAIFCPLVKVDEAKREVWGVVTAEVPDRDDEICDYDTTTPYYKTLVEEMTKASEVNPEGGTNIFPLRAMHGLIAAGKGIAIEFRDEAKEVYMGFKVVDDNEWKKVQQNVYTGFSQGGRYIKRWKDGDFIRYTAKPGEISLVDIPCLQRAHFDYVKADGSVEMRKFASKVAEVPTGNAGAIPTTPTAVSDVDPTPVETGQGVDMACKCGCKACKAGDHAGCEMDTKCAASKAVKYLVTDKDGKGHLPYTNEDGKPNHRLMGAAWAALHGGYRGNKYEGPDKEKAKKKLKQVYAREGMDTPSEKALVIDDLLKTMLVDSINNRAYGQLNKGLYTVSRYASILEDVKYLWLTAEYEREAKGDESPATDDLREAFSRLLDGLVSYTEEQIAEEKASPFMHEALGV